MNDQFWLGTAVGAITAFGVLTLWGLARISRQRANALCRWCGGRRDQPVVVQGGVCPSPFHSGHPDWDF